MNNIPLLKFSTQIKISKPSGRKNMTMRQRARIKDKDAVTFESTLHHDVIKIKEKMRNDLFYKAKMNFRLKEIQSNSNKSFQNSSPFSSERSCNDSLPATMTTIKQYRQKQKMNDEALLIKYRDLITENIFGKLF